MTSPESGIHLNSGPENMNTFKKLNLNTFYGHVYDYISFLAQEYGYIYLLGEVNMGTNRMQLYSRCNTKKRLGWAGASIGLLLV